VAHIYNMGNMVHQEGESVLSTAEGNNLRPVSVYM